MFKKTATIALAIRFVTSFDFLIPIWFFYGTDVLELSSSATIVLYMFFPISIAVFEIPTGALADRLGPKKVSIVGLLLASFYPLSYLLFPSLPFMIAICSTIGGFGYSLFSGTSEALVHASFEKDKLPQTQFNRYLANDRIARFSARILVGVSAGYAYSLWKPSPYIGVVLSYSVGILLFALIKEPQMQRSRLSQTKHIRITWKHILSKELLQALIVSFIGVQLIAESLWTGYQPFYKADGLSATSIGAIFSATAICAVFGAHISSALLNRFGVLQIMLSRSLILTLATFLLLQPLTWLRIFALLPAAIVFGISWTPLKAAILFLVPATYHTTAISIVSLLTMATYALASLHLGLLIDLVGITVTRRLLFTESIVIAAVLFVLYTKQKTHDLTLST